MLSLLSGVFSRLDVTQENVVDVWCDVLQEQNFHVMSIAANDILNDPSSDGDRPPTPAQFKFLCDSIKTASAETEALNRGSSFQNEEGEISMPPDIKVLMSEILQRWNLNLSSGKGMNKGDREELQEKLEASQERIIELADALIPGEISHCPGCHGTGWANLYRGGRAVATKACTCEDGRRFTQSYRIASDEREWKRYRIEQQQKQKAKSRGKVDRNNFTEF